MRNGKDTLFFAIPVLKNNNACLKCHGDPKDAPRKMVEMYGDKNSILSVHNDDRRRMREGKKWTPDLDRPRGGKRFQ